MEGCQLLAPLLLGTPLHALTPHCPTYPGCRQAVEGRQLIAPLLQPGLNPLEMLVLRDQRRVFELWEGHGGGGRVGTRGSDAHISRSRRAL